MHIVCDDNYFLLGAVSCNKNLSRELSLLSERVFIITSSCATRIFLFIKTHNAQEGVFFCSERAMRLLRGVVKGKIYTLNDFTGITTIRSLSSAINPCYVFSRRDRYLLKSFIENHSISKKMRFLKCDYKKLMAYQLNLRNKLQCINNIELFCKAQIIHTLNNS